MGRAAAATESPSPGDEVLILVTLHLIFDGGL